MSAIEEHLDGTLDVPKIARSALTSEYHFRRMFSALSGMPLSEYVRRRRLTVAAAAVVEGRESVQDIAVRFGYGSADAFARAFKAMHGVGPEEARQPGVTFRSQSQLSFHLRVDGSRDIEYRILTKDAFRIVGMKTSIPLVKEGRNGAIAAFEASINDKDYERIGALCDQEPSGVLAVCDNFDQTHIDGTDLDYYVAVTTSLPTPTGLSGIDVAAGSWVVFHTAGPFPETLQQLWTQAYSEWFPSNPYRLAPGPEIVRADLREDDNYAEAELWFPVEPTS
ncbi:AraC family transcriptional regulator [Nesterenkonia haasae]|uniref:AraC family transcriptional regulator n=1 Tax=Nesterenkonia haasae TaxID=2587813 RepID=UPI0013918BC1|nr:AraC family transcriptional regulator [Nesterenkonia haasae]NDK30436.1 AraC family transcriptional regulator [Nesterenkonia haasae]